MRRIQGDTRSLNYSSNDKHIQRSTLISYRVYLFSVGEQVERFVIEGGEEVGVPARRICGQAALFFCGC